MKTIKSVLAISILAAASSAAIADPFYLNNGIDHEAPLHNTGSQVAATTTGIFQEMTYHYWSSTVLMDANNDAVFSAGDTFTSTGGLLNSNTPVVTTSTGSTSTDQLSGNAITGFSPQWSFGSAATEASDNGFQSDWNMSFGFDNLTGFIGGPSGLGFIYQSGNIIMTYYDAINTMGIKVLDLEVGGGTNNGIGQSLDLFGNLSVLNGASAIDGGLTVDDLFVLSDFDLTFSEYLALDPLNTIRWDNNQNTSPFFVNGIETTNPADIIGTPPAFIDGIYGGVAGGTGNLSGEHDGSMAFSVPEPSPVALFSLALLGMAGIRKLKAS